MSDHIINRMFYDKGIYNLLIDNYDKYIDGEEVVYLSEVEEVRMTKDEYKRLRRTDKDFKASTDYIGILRNTGYVTFYR